MRRKTAEERIEEDMKKRNEPAPYDQKASDVKGRELVHAEKAYKNEEFLMSRDARNIRILCEFEETLTRIRRQGVIGTFLFFGSARAMYREDWEREMALAKERLTTAHSAKEKEDLQMKIERLGKTEWLCEYMVKCEELARKLTEWSLTAPMLEISSGVHPGGKSLRTKDAPYLAEGGGVACDLPSSRYQKYVVSSGGGPGLMEAANRGASKVPGGRSAGFAISLPFEKGLNPYVTPGLAFTFHYFFTRKYWMMYPAKVLIALPGGFGTLDELFESVTLKQTGKKPPFPTVLIGKDYWTKTINWDELARLGTISKKDIESLFITDDVDEAFQYIKDELITSAAPGSPIKRTLDPPVPLAAKRRKPESMLLPAATSANRDKTPESPLPPPQ